MFVSDRRWPQLGWPSRGPWAIRGLDGLKTVKTYLFIYELKTLMFLLIWAMNGMESFSLYVYYTYVVIWLNYSGAEGRASHRGVHKHSADSLQQLLCHVAT